MKKIFYKHFTVILLELNENPKSFSKNYLSESLKRNLLYFKNNITEITSIFLNNLYEEYLMGDKIILVTKKYNKLDFISNNLENIKEDSNEFIFEDSIKLKKKKLKKDKKIIKLNKRKIKKKLNTDKKTLSKDLTKNTFSYKKLFYDLNKKVLKKSGLSKWYKSNKNDTNKNILSNNLKVNNKIKLNINSKNFISNKLKKNSKSFNFSINKKNIKKSNIKKNYDSSKSSLNSKNSKKNNNKIIKVKNEGYIKLF